MIERDPTSFSNHSPLTTHHFFYLLPIKFDTKLSPQISFDAFQTARHMTFGVTEDLPNFVQRPTRVFSQGQHRQIFPTPPVVSRIMFVHPLPKIIRARPR